MPGQHGEEIELKSGEDDRRTSPGHDSRDDVDDQSRGASVLLGLPAVHAQDMTRLLHGPNVDGRNKQNCRPFGKHGAGQT